MTKQGRTKFIKTRYEVNLVKTNTCIILSFQLGSWLDIDLERQAYSFKIQERSENEPIRCK